MSDSINITYLEGLEKQLKIINPITKGIEILSIPKDDIKKIKTIEEFNSDNAIYFMVKESKRKVSLEFLINSSTKKEDKLNEIYKELYKDNVPKIYIGETTRTRTRYDNHHIKDYDYIIIFISKEKNGFSENEILYMEEYYYNKYKDSIYCHVMNKKPKGAVLAKLEELKVKRYIQEVNQMLIIINENIFNFNLKPHQIIKKGVKAKGYIVDDKLTIVVKGSEAVTEITSSSVNRSLDKKRQSLIEQGILKLKNGKYIFYTDYIFKSKSGAAECILGTSRSGPETWKEIKF